MGENSTVASPSLSYVQTIPSLTMSSTQLHKIYPVIYISSVNIVIHEAQLIRFALTKNSKPVKSFSHCLCDGDFDNLNRGQEIDTHSDVFSSIATTNLTSYLPPVMQLQDMFVEDYSGSSVSLLADWNGNGREEQQYASTIIKCGECSSLCSLASRYNTFFLFGGSN